MYNKNTGDTMRIDYTLIYDDNLGSACNEAADVAIEIVQSSSREESILLANNIIPKIAHKEYKENLAAYNILHSYLEQILDALNNQGIELDDLACENEIVFEFLNQES